MAELELKNTMLEYEKLLTKKDSLLKAIESAKEENGKIYYICLSINFLY